MPMRKIVNKETGVDPTEYVGEMGEAWISDNDTLLRLGDGATPGGVPLNNRLQNGDFSAPMNADGSITIPGTIKTTGTMTLTGYGVEYTSYVAVWDDAEDDSDLTARAVAYDSQGNSYVLMHYQFPGAGLWKLDPAGNKLWGKYSEGYVSEGFGLAVDHHDNPVIVNGVYIEGTGVGVTKFNGVNGSIAWSTALTDLRTYTSMSPAIACDAEGNVFVAGFLYNPEADLTEFLVAKLAAKDGQPVWSKGYNVNGTDNLGFCIVIDNAGDVVVGGNKIYDNYNTITFFKLKNADGSLVWSKDTLDPAIFGTDDSVGLIIGGASVDSANNIYFNATWQVQNAPVAVPLTIKLDKDGVFQWGRSTGQLDYVPVGMSVATDKQDNTYSLSLYYLPAGDYDPNYYDNWDPNYSGDRFIYSVIKFDTNGKTLWQRFLTDRQYQTAYPYGDVTMYGAAGVTLVAVNDEYLLIGGSRYITSEYDTNQEWYSGAFALQMPKDGLTFSHDGWTFKDSSLQIVGVTTPTFASESPPYVFEDVELAVDKNYVWSFYDSTVRFARNSIEEMPQQSIIIDGSGVNMDRPTVGTFTTYGNFDGTEGGNVWGDTYFYQLARDANDNVYVSGGDQYNDRDYITKINPQGGVEWSATTNYDPHYYLVAVAVDPTTQNPVYVSMDGNEGFNVVAMNPAGGVVYTTHVVGGLNQNWYNPTGVAVNSKGEAAVAGYITFGTQDYSNLTARQQSGADVLVVDKHSFSVGDYPDYLSDWYIHFNGDYYDIVDVNSWYNLGSTTNSQNGTGSTWNVHIDPGTNAYMIDQGNNGGVGYKVNDEVYIAGDLVLGDPTANKITLTVTAVDGGGSITAWTVKSGTAQTDYIKLIITTGGSVTFVVDDTYTVRQANGETAFVYTPNWQRVVGTTESGNNYFTSVAVDSKDAVIAGGYFGGLSGDKPGLVIKFDSEGNEKWRNCLDIYYTEVNGVAVDKDDNIVVFHTPWDDRVYVSKINGETGETMWRSEIGNGAFSAEPYDGLAVDEEGYIYVGGVYYAGDLCFNNSFLVVKIDPNGGLVYMRDVYSIYDLYNDYDGNRSQSTISVKNGMMSLAFGYSRVPGDYYYQATVATLPADGSGHGNYGPWIYREVEYRFYQYTFPDNYSPEDLGIVEHVFDIQSYGPPAIAQYYGMQDKLTGVMKSPHGGQVALGNILFEDGSVMDTSGQDIPQVDQTKTNYSQYLIQLEDRGKHIYSWGNSIVVPTDAEINFPIGSVITIVTDNNTSYVYCDDNGTTKIRGVGADSGSSSYNIAAYSLVTLFKVNRNYWMLSGSVFTAN